MGCLWVGFSASLLGSVLMGFARRIPIWAVAAFMGMFFVPIINGSNQAIWQAKVPPDLQGRVFSIRRLIAWFVSPLAMLVAGPLADKVLEPAMRNPQSLPGFCFGLGYRHRPRSWYGIALYYRGWPGCAGRDQRVRLPDLTGG